MCILGLGFQFPSLVHSDMTVLFGEKPSEQWNMIVEFSVVVEYDFKSITTFCPSIGMPQSTKLLQHHVESMSSLYNIIKMKACLMDTFTKQISWIRYPSSFPCTCGYSLFMWRHPWVTIVDNLRAFNSTTIAVNSYVCTSIWWITVNCWYWK